MAGFQLFSCSKRIILVWDFLLLLQYPPTLGARFTQWAVRFVQIWSGSHRRNLLWWEIEKTISDKDLSRRLQNIATKSNILSPSMTMMFLRSEVANAGWAHLILFGQVCLGKHRRCWETIISLHNGPWLLIFTPAAQRMKNPELRFAEIQWYLHGNTWK